MSARIRVVGLTGGIGSGKSTVARFVAELGVPVLDADRLAREVVEPGQPAHAEIAAAWPDAIGADGRVDRARLGARVFSDAAARRRLEAITHPRIQELARRRTAALQAQGHTLAVYEASLLVEGGRHRDLDGLIVVTAPDDVRVRRVMARDGASEDAVRARIAAQLPLAEKIKVATHVIANDGDLEATRAQTTAVVEALRGGSSGAAAT